MVNSPKSASMEESARLLEDEDPHPETLYDEKEAADPPPPPRASFLRYLVTPIAQIFLWLVSCFTALRQYSFLQILQAVSLFLLPSFARRTADPKGGKVPVRISSHAHLDGLRGVAALFVFFFHSSYVYFDVRAGFASGRDGEYMSPLRLPFLRLLYSGDAMVSVFYLISGFVLSIKPIRLMHAGTFDELFLAVSSGGFRRGVRLFFPCLVSTFIVMICIRIGLYDLTRSFAQDAEIFKGNMEWHMFRTDTLWEQLVSWATQTANFIHVWEWYNIYAGNTGYDVHLW